MVLGGGDGVGGGVGGYSGGCYDSDAGGNGFDRNNCRSYIDGSRSSSTSREISNSGVDGGAVVCECKFN
ncbi:hypothetical protein DPMN_060313 [Dreissena polymorpha]|uniref:Uncharacterized protein n=1 Tax=Dreissena polymorpha TaxID=45954 RepID=A0A9D4C4Z9_DREPO|nr:hypothetical protein DPMN_060313 [Dreissena polymorpha]